MQHRQMPHLRSSPRLKRSLAEALLDRNPNPLFGTQQEYRGRNGQRSWAQFLSGLRMLFEAGQFAAGQEPGRLR